MRAMRDFGVPMQMINGRHDLVAGLGYVQRLARRLRCPLILTGARGDCSVVTMPSAHLQLRLAGPPFPCAWPYNIVQSFLEEHPARWRHECGTVRGIRTV